MHLQLLEGWTKWFRAVRRNVTTNRYELDRPDARGCTRCAAFAARCDLTDVIGEKEEGGGRERERERQRFATVSRDEGGRERGREETREAIGRNSTSQNAFRDIISDTG